MVRFKRKSRAFFSQCNKVLSQTTWRDVRVLCNRAISTRKLQQGSREVTKFLPVCCMCYLAHSSLNWLSVKTRVELKSGENCILFKKSRVIELFSPAQLLAYTLLIIETLQSWRFLLIIFAQLRKGLSFRLYQDSSNDYTSIPLQKVEQLIECKSEGSGGFFSRKKFPGRLRFLSDCVTSFCASWSVRVFLFLMFPFVSA